MTFLPLSVSLVNKTKEEILGVLQGISRYIENIHVEEPLLENEGLEILTFLKKRYPKKKIVVDLSKTDKFDENIFEWIKRSVVKTFIISSALNLKELKSFVNFLQEHKKEIIVRGQEFPVRQLKLWGINKLFFYQSQPKNKIRLWLPKECQAMQKLIQKDFSLLVGDINVKNLPSLQKLPAQGFVFSEEVCYSFNPIETSKRIYLKIKAEYSPE